MLRALPKIKPSDSIVQLLSNLASGDIVYIDIDGTLFYNSTRKYEVDPQLTEAFLDQRIHQVQERGIEVIAITARETQYREITQMQLAKLNIKLNEIIHAPSYCQTDGLEIPQKSVALLQSLAQKKNIKRIFMIDNDHSQLQDILEHCAHLPIFLKHYVPVTYQPIMINTITNQFFPINLDGFVLKKSLGGGTRSTYQIYHPLTKQTLVLKYGAHDDAGRIEILCKATYHALGVTVPLMRVYHVIPHTLAKSLNLTHTTGMFQVSEYITPHPEQSQKVIAEAAANDYIAHFLLDNTDIMKTDNFMRDVNDKVYLIDAGSNFLFNGMGNYRMDADKMHTTLLQVQQHAPKWYGHLADENFREQSLRLVAKHREIETAVWQAAHHLQLPEDMRNQFLQHLSERLDYLMVRFSGIPQSHALEDKLATPKYTAAGVLTCVTINDDIYVLLSKRCSSGFWDNMGGKSNASDITLIETAKREVFEESSGQLNYHTAQLEACPFHDLVWMRKGKLFTYRMYICHTQAIDLTQITDKEHTEHVWVELNSLLNNTHNYELLPEFADMLNQQPVYQQLECLLRRQGMTRSHTLGYRNLELLDDTPDDFNYRPIVVPQQKRRQIAKTLLQQSCVLRELKAANMLFYNPFLPVKRELIQAEIHLKALLDNDFIANDDEGNLERFIEMKYKHEGCFASANNRRRLQEIALQFLQHERAHPELIDCFHACNHIVSFTYRLYSEIYTILNASDDWHALRIDNGQFRFRSIQEFIAHFSDGGKQPINNNESGFHECAISANLFPFGNHTTPTSSSPHYLMDNDVRRDLLLPELLESLFKPFHITSLEIKRILNVFNIIKSYQQGTIYQISLTRSQAHEMAYVSGNAGVLNEFEGTYRLDVVLDYLRDADLTDNEVKKFLSHVQLRVMVPPHAALQVNEVRWQELPEQVEANYQHELAACAEFIAEMMLRHHKQYGVANAKTPLLRQLPSILLANQLGVLPSISDNIIANAVRSQDEATIVSILRTYPIYKTKVFTIDGVATYLKDNAWSTSKYHGARKILDWVVHVTNLPLANIIACFGNTWLLELGEVPINYYEKLQSIIERLPGELRLAYFNIKYQQTTDRGFINNNNINDYIQLIPESSRSEFVRFHPDLFKNLGHCGINDCMSHIPVAERVALADFICPYLEHGYDVATLTEILLPEEQYPFLLRNQKYLRCGFDVSEALQFIPPHEKHAFALSVTHVYQDYFGTNQAIEKMNLEGNDLTQFLLKVIPNFQKCDGNDFWLLTLLRKVQLSDRLLIAEKLTAFFTPENNRVVSFAELLLPTDRLAYVERHLRLLNTYHYANVAKHFTEEEAIYFAYRYASQITDGTYLGFILEHLPLHARLQYAKDNIHLITKANELSHVSEHISQCDIINFVELIVERIEDKEKIACVLGRIPEPHRLHYIERFRQFLQRDEMLDLMLYFTPKSERFQIALQHAHLIKSSHYLRNITLKLPEELRVVFITHTRLKHINNNFICVMDDLSEDDKLLLAVCMQGSITNRNQLKETTFKLPAKDRFAYLSLHPMHYQSLYDAEELSLCLEGQQKIDFIKPHLPSITSKEELLLLKGYFTQNNATLISFINFYQNYQHPTKTIHVSYLYWLQSLYAPQRVDFIAVFINQLLTETTIGQLCHEVPKENRTEFAIAYHDKITDYPSLYKLLPFIADEKRAEIISNHLHVVDSDRKLNSLLKLVTHNRNHILQQWKQQQQPTQPFTLFQPEPKKCKHRKKKLKPHHNHLGITY